jgi:hypothetical protein
MKAITLYRIASVLLVILAAGHTFWLLSFRPTAPEGLAVWNAMNNVHFRVKGSSFSYGDIYAGFGLLITLNVLFSAFLAWHLGTVASSTPLAIGALGWAFCAAQLVSLAVSLKYFSGPPVVFSALLAVWLGWAAWLVPGK